MVDLGGYVIILVETHDKKVKLYGSPADKADLEVADEILEINGESLTSSTHKEVIAHIHNCIKSRTICLRVKRRTGNKLAKEVAENSHVQDAFVIAVEQQAKERLERLSALRKIKPVDMTKLSQELCEESPENEDNSKIYSAPVSELGSTTNLSAAKPQQPRANNLRKMAAGASDLQSTEVCTAATKAAESEAAAQSGYVTDEELELRQTLQPSCQGTKASKKGHLEEQQQQAPLSLVDNNVAAASLANSVTSPSKEILIGGDNSSRRSSRGSVKAAMKDRIPSSLSEGPLTCRPAGASKSKLHKAFPEESATDVSTCDDASQMPLPQTPPPCSLKSVVDVEEMLRCLERLNSSESVSGLLCESKLVSLESLLLNERFQKLLTIHNTIQSVQCFQCPPSAICSDTRALVQQCMESLQDCAMPEAAEVLNILNRIEFEGLFFSHDKLAERQSALPWEQYVSDMWTKNTSCRPASAAATAVASDLSGSKEQLDRPASAGSMSACSTLKRPPMMNDAESAAKCNDLGSTSSLSNTISKTKVVKILKQNEPLGATVRNEGDRVVIGRVVKGGAAERSGQLFPGDEVLEVNGLKLKGKSVHDICDTLCQMTGTLTFVIIPSAKSEELTAKPGRAPDGSDGRDEAERLRHYRAHFSYNPDDDLYIPCHELGISFQKGDILHVINQEDPHWWQAYRDGEWNQTLAGLIPSLSLQQHRMALQRQKRDQDLREQREQERNSSPSKKKASAASNLLCAKKSNKRKRLNSPFKRAQRFDIPPYEEMSLYYPQTNQKRPMILVGPPSIGRHELRQRLLEDTTRFAAAVPHTTRLREEGEIDGQDYIFVSRSQFEQYIGSGQFVEHGEYEKQYYGTSLDAIRTVINSGKICVLNLQPSSLKILHESDLKPYVLFLTPPPLQLHKQLKAKYGEPFREDEYRDSVAIAHDMEDNFGHYFDSVLPFDDVDCVYQQLMFEINLLQREPQWVPVSWIKQN